MVKPEPRLKPPKSKSVPIVRLARSEVIFWLAVTGLMLFLLAAFHFLSFRQGKHFPLLVTVLWIVVFVSWTGWLTRSAWRQYRRALALDRDPVTVSGIVVGFYDEDTSLGDQAITQVYWVIFRLEGEDRLFGQVVSLDTYQKLHAGDRIEVLALASDHRICRARLD